MRHQSHRSPRACRPTRALAAPTAVAALGAAALATLPPAAARAQVPGLPVAPGAFVRPGLAVAANAAVGGSRWSYGGAFAFAPGSGRWQLVGGGAAVDPGPGYRNPSTAFGARAVVPIVVGRRFGVAGFAGAGAVRHRFAERAGGGADDTARVSLLQVPVGAALGVRGAWLGGRAWALTAVPQYSWSRLDALGDATSAGRVRASLVGELALSRRLGIAVAVETGARGDLEEPGPRGTLVGAGVSFALGGARP